MLAIVIPYYKIDYFEETLIALANQIDKRFKVYIGDDGSPNPPAELILKYHDCLNIHYKRFVENIGLKELDLALDALH
jgi:cellulose synthase/poly-beta-1,6-N-acetylglucosamine synthase-like glycosyltransferase